MKPFCYYKINLSVEKFKDAVKLEGRRKYSTKCIHRGYINPFPSFSLCILTPVRSYRYMLWILSPPLNIK